MEPVSRTNAARLLGLTAVASSLALLSTAAQAQARLVTWGCQEGDGAHAAATFSAIAAGEKHTVVCRPDGTLAAWGAIQNDQMLLPAPPAGAKFVELAAARFYTLALTDTGQIVSWGDDFFPTGVPALPPGVTYTAMDAARFHALALRSDGEVVFWGQPNPVAPPPSPAPGTAFVSVASGVQHAVALQDDGAVVGWGDNSFGQLDLPSLPAGVTYLEVEATYYISFGLRSDGLIETAGIGIGLSFVPALPPGVGYVDIEANEQTSLDGNPHVLALRSDGELVAWGSTKHGKTMVPALPPGRSWDRLAVGTHHSAALLDDGTYVTWGRGWYGQLGIPALPPGESVALLEAGDDFCLFQSTGGGSLQGWGTNDKAQLTGLTPALDLAAGADWGAAVRTVGNLATWGHDAPAIPFPPTGTSYTQVEISEPSVFALRSDGVVVESGPSTIDFPPPPAGTPYVEIALGKDHGLARLSDGTVLGFGSNSAGAIVVPALPPGLAYVEIACSDQSSFARRSDGSVIAWGHNGNSQLVVPPLPAGTAYVELAAGAWASLVLLRRSDGELVRTGSTFSNFLDPPELAPGEVWVAMDFSTPVDPLACGNFGVGAIDTGPPCGTVSRLCEGGFNSQFTSARIEVTGCPSLAANDLTLDVSGLPPGVQGIFFYGDEFQSTPFGAGEICALGAVTRVPGSLVSSPAGTVSLDLDLSGPPFSAGPGAVLPGSSKIFQYWYRDPPGGGGGFNLSDAAHIQFGS